MTSASLGRGEDAVVTVVGVANISEEVRSLAALEDANYADLFTATTDLAAVWSAECWARALLEDTSAGRSAPVLWRLLGLRLGPTPSTEYVQGWKIADDGHGWIRIETASRCMTAHAVVAVEGRRVSLALFIRYDRPEAALIWPGVSVLHRRGVPVMLRQALSIQRAGGSATSQLPRPTRVGRRGMDGMEQLYFIDRGHVEWREVQRPELIDGADALVRPIAVATCDLDTGLIHGQEPFAGPFPLGHEGVGEVIEIGSDVTTVAPGQRVIIPFQVSCGLCRRCIRGLTGSCESVHHGAMFGLEPFGGPWGGFLSDVVRVPWADHMLVPLPDGIDPVAVASLSDNIPDAWRTVAPFIDDPADVSVLVVGGGTPSLPFYSIAIAKALGVKQIDYLEFGGGNPDRLEKASRCGASIIESPDEVRSGSYGITVCSCNQIDALRLALRSAQPDGICAVNTIFFQDDVPLPMFSMYTRGVHLVTGRVNARAVIPKPLGLIAGGVFCPEAVTDEVATWRDAADALVAQPRKLVIQRTY